MNGRMLGQSYNFDQQFHTYKADQFVLVCTLICIIYLLFILLFIIYILYIIFCIMHIGWVIGFLPRPKCDTKLTCCWELRETVCYW